MTIEEDMKVSQEAEVALALKMFDDMKEKGLSANDCFRILCCMLISLIEGSDLPEADRLPAMINNITKIYNRRREALNVN